MSTAALAVLLLGAVEAMPPRIDLRRAAAVYAQVEIRQRVIVRVPTRPPQETTSPYRWREKRGPRCIPAGALAGAALNEEQDSIDLILRGGARVRARLEKRCPAVGYYSGFYLRPGRDGMICEDRDSILARSGGECEIERFRSLVPEPRR